MQNRAAYILTTGEKCGSGLQSGRGFLFDLLGLGFYGKDADEAAILALVLEENNSVDRGEERIVLAAADVPAGLVARAALANENRAGIHELAAESLDAEPLSLGIAAVDRRAAAFFVCHGEKSFACVEFALI